MLHLHSALSLPIHQRRLLKPYSIDGRVTVEAGGPGRDEQAALLYEKWLLDVPKLLDIAVLYGRDNPELVQQLMQKVNSIVTHRLSCQPMEDLC